MAKIDGSSNHVEKVLKLKRFQVFEKQTCKFFPKFIVGDLDDDLS